MPNIMDEPDEEMLEIYATIAAQSDQISKQGAEIERLRADLRLANDSVSWPAETWVDKLCDQHEIMEDQLGMHQAYRAQDIVRLTEQGKRIAELEERYQEESRKNFDAMWERARAEAAEAENVKLRLELNEGARS